MPHKGSPPAQHAYDAPPMRLFLLALSPRLFLRPALFLTLALLPVPTACAPATPPSPSPPAPPFLPPSAPAPGATLAPEQALRPLENATCVVHSEKALLLEPLALSYRGKEFAAAQQVRRIELRANPGAATLEVSTERFTATGEVDLGDIVLGPRTHAAQVHDEWLTVWRARAKAVSGNAADSLAVDVTLPSVVTPAAPLALSYRCDELTFAPEVETPAFEFRRLKRGAKSPLRRVPRGEVVAWLASSPDEPPDEVAELERKGRAVRIAIPDADVLVQGWVDASALSSKKPSAPELMGALNAGAPTDAPNFSTVRCSADVPFYVRDDDSAVRVRVGALHGNTEIRRGAVNQRGEVPIDLGVDAGRLTPPLQPFVLATAIAGCVEAAVR